MLLVARVIHQTAEMDVMGFSQMPQDLQRPYLFSLDRGVGNTLCQEQQTGQDRMSFGNIW
jgi:hypothetical protein